MTSDICMHLHEITKGCWYEYFTRCHMRSPIKRQVTYVDRCYFTSRQLAQKHTTYFHPFLRPPSQCQ